MEHLDEIMRLAEAELEAVAKNGKFRSREEIESVGKLIDIGKDIECMWGMDEPDDSGEYSGNYSRNGRYYRGGGSYAYGNGYGDRSYARGRGRNARRDSMGRYSRNSYGYSMDGKSDYMEQLRDMMESAPDEKTRMSVQKMIREMEAE